MGDTSTQRRGNLPCSGMSGVFPCGLDRSKMFCGLLLLLLSCLSPMPEVLRRPRGASPMVRQRRRRRMQSTLSQTKFWIWYFDAAILLQIFLRIDYRFLLTTLRLCLVTCESTGHVRTPRKRDSNRLPETLGVSLPALSHSTTPATKAEGKASF
jgi:hypothetical protein